MINEEIDSATIPNSISALSNSAQPKFAPSNLASLRLAPFNLTPYKLARVNIDSLKFSSFSLTLSNVAPVKSLSLQQHTV